jgi:PIN domain nuclease of toxin-antitoxin system
MKLLLDTHPLLWFLADDPKLSATAKATIMDPANERMLSPSCRCTTKTRSTA